MGLFDFLKKDQVKEKTVQTISKTEENQILGTSQGLVPIVENIRIPENIQQLLWFADGKLKNYNQKSKQSTFYENELFRITFSFYEVPEPSLISTKLPVDLRTNPKKVEELGYYPSYEGLNPQQRFVYLNWLKDITKPVDIGYVFVFYYGLERHLISGKYADATDTILNLRQYHKNNSFHSYSANALIISAILHKDKETLSRVLEDINDTSYCSSLVLLGKYLMQMDLTIDEIISISSTVGFTNKRYIKEYPDLFKKSLESILMDKFGKNSYPIYELNMQFPSNPIMSFANISLDRDVRSPVLPDLMQSPEFSSSIKSILTTAHNDVKQYLAEMRKKGTAPKSKSDEIVDDGPKPECPYCHKLLDKMPKSKSKCPHCEEEITVRTDPVEKKKILLRMDQIDEFEEKVREVRTHKTIERILGSNFTKNRKYLHIEKDLKKKLNIEPSEKEVALLMVEDSGEEYYNNLNMGLFRNTILYKADILKASGDMQNALTLYLELLYFDLNGPNNSPIGKHDPELLKRYPPFNPKDSGSAFIAPGIINYIKTINKDLNLSKEEIKQIFFEHNIGVENARKLPLRVQDAWDKLEPEIIL
ncbi:TerB N-terminal domain-containing protein [Methanogenium sp. S4BF]|uniref:TerB N-terminal domain-containing protein n=1 Tax=Methanogenium sp. S4BF TaxID=1789226 RepID=UPI002415AE96|nr:TerB N-terminal domain-containing protein [Methanogenium sp. S4BF]WFN33869.1 TerB N-terminal domain-containing protein [Methanogenium sp. S4BF]